MPVFPKYGYMPFKYYNPYRMHNFQNNYKPSASQFANYECQAPKYESYVESDKFVSNKKSFSHDVSSNSENVSQKNTSCVSKENGDVLFELFGLKLYFDDVLILSLLFFLYKEEVKDEGLFLALVLLLIS